MNYIKISAFILISLILGIVGLSLVFSDPSPGETTRIRIFAAGLFFLLSGAVIGFFNAKLWMISGLIAWGGVLMGGFITLMAVRRYGANAFSAQEPPYITVGLMMLLLPITFALLGGYVGKLISQKRAQLR